MKYHMGEADNGGTHDNNAEQTGGTTNKVMTSRAQDAESWHAALGVRLVSRQKLELDDILTLLIEQERLRVLS